MTRLLQGPVAPPGIEPLRPVDQSADVVTVTPRRQSPTHGPPDRLKGMVEFVLGWPLGILIVAVQCLFYAFAVLAVPVLPFLLPLALAPAALLAAMFILVIGRVVVAFGVGQWWL